MDNPYVTYYNRFMSLSERLFSRVNKDAPNGCWEWTERVEDGYGRMFYKGKMERCHRISWILVRGDIPDKMQVLHTCDNRRCVNPDHLFLGTNLDNMKDRNAKGRQAIGERNYHKLTEQDVLKIRSLYSTKQNTRRELSKMFDVSYAQIDYIVRFKSWKWLK